jgi:hypothetical protein
MQFVRVPRLRPRLRANARNGCGIQNPQSLAAGRVARAPRMYRLRAPLLQRCVVQECVRARVENLVGQG